MNMFSIYHRFQLRQMAEDAPAPDRDLGIAQLFARLVALGGTAPLSITVDAPGAGLAEPSPVQTSHGAPEPDAQWSLWAYGHGHWSWVLIGATCLDDIAETLIEFMRREDNSADELRICPAGTMPPRALTRAE